MTDLPPPRSLNLIERGFLKVLPKLSESIEGYYIAFGEEIIRTHGLLGFFRWAKLTGSTQQGTRDHFGVQRQHLLSAFASMWNGCDYCAHGNILAHNLFMFRDENKLFPVTEEMLLDMHRWKDDEILAEVQRLLADDFKEELRLIERQWQLKSTMEEPDNEEDRQLWLSVRQYDFINECSIVVDAPAPPFNHIAKDTEVRARYAKARAASSNGTS